MWGGIEDLCGMNDKHVYPRAPTLADHIENAQAMRDSIQRQCDRSVCAVCSMMKPTEDIIEIDDLQSVPHIELLDASIESTPDCYRSGLTSYMYNDTIKYCLQPDACRHNDMLDQTEVDVCVDCHRQLSAGRVPTEALARFDGGEILRHLADTVPVSIGELHSVDVHFLPCRICYAFPWCAGAIPEGLLPLNRIEENLLSRNRVHRNLYVMKPATWTWTVGGTQQLGHKAHVIATPNTGPGLVRDCLLQHPDSLNDTLQVVFLVLVDSDNPDTIAAKIKKMVKNSSALRIRGWLVLKWAHHLCQVGAFQSPCITIVACTLL
jgi:hypothetical protein